MGKMFADGEVGKLYAAVVHGRVERESFEVDAPIGKTMEEVTPRPEELKESDLAEDLPRYVPRRRVDHERGKPAVTRFEVERFLGRCTLVRAIPLSGRTNQIRVHLDHVGHPIVGDKVYKPAEPDAADGLISRQALHCRELRFSHPTDRRPVRIESAYPEDFARLIGSLEESSGETV